MQNLDLLGFLSLGFFGGFGHCIGMCHPFVLYISGRFVGGNRGYSKMYAPHLKYNLGRSVTYAVMGAAAGALGNIATLAGNMAGIQKTSAVFAGVFLILYGLLSFFGYNLLNKLENRFAAEKIMNLIKRIQPKTAFGSGLVLGLIPCGLVYGALIAASASANAAKGAFSMFLFGIGTITAMMLAAVFGNFIMGRRGIFNLLSLILLICMGVWFIWQGVRF
ncbi:sulfite exporter TauE/SafE family protein [Geovibrio thiophilus]|uniref:Sulfite exporter TauE/SafE family protein n=1 Tax=Geovibrio thiophilus TaxID=139438 RepID=A0A3R5XW15_9BACT|nr:sulfite exporter TauE/SafE family protein [Geovibrio thiophilus]QAR32480.1 sulfite exporter TauE/SafE family protein [Geovibrio thiophilus]